MSFSTKSATVALLVACTVATASATYECGSKCRFTFCGNDGSYVGDEFMIGGTPDIAFTGAICDKDREIIVGSVDSTGEALVATPGGDVPISQYSPSGLLQPFSPSFFKSYLFEHVLRSGVGHETPQQNQLDFLERRCVTLPLTAYQVLDAHTGNVVDNVHPEHPYPDCVSFVTRVKHYEH